MRKCPRRPAESCRSSWKILEIPSFVRAIRATNSVFYTSQLTPHFHADLTDYMHNEFIWRSQSQSQLRLVAFSSHSIHSFIRIVVYHSGALAMHFKANQHQENQKCRSHFELYAREKRWIFCTQQRRALLAGKLRFVQLLVALVFASLLLLCMIEKVKNDKIIYEDVWTALFSHMSRNVCCVFVLYTTRPFNCIQFQFPPYIAMMRVDEMHV